MFTTNGGFNGEFNGHYSAVGILATVHSKLKINNWCNFYGWKLQTLSHMYINGGSKQYTNLQWEHSMYCIGIYFQGLDFCGFCGQLVIAKILLAKNWIVSIKFK